ncbi:MAG: isocitrate/isopropylmalate dehydrogenase family protein, partial [Deltaproteobacteria bacterium]|nr:isocitrate/isopropylmalate dehydrogenase family protein [Deltaproteobacteria bacterium]
MRPSLAVIERLGVDIEWLHPPVGAAGIEQAGSAFPDEARAAIDAADATLFGATNGLSALALFYLRWGKQTYANVRPTRFMPGASSPLASPNGIDFVIVRENLEDMYLGVEGDLLDLAPLGLQSFTAQCPVVDLAPGAFALKAITERGSDRVARFAFELARRRKARGFPGRVLCAAKYNMLMRSDGLFRDRVRRVAEQYPDIELQTYIVDDFARRLVAEPHSLDVVVLPNLYGDILSDAAAGLVGGLGVAASGCYGDDYAYFESVHGSAPDIAGKNVINPTATLLSAALLLEYLGFASAGRRLEAAIEAVYAGGSLLTPDQRG